MASLTTTPTIFETLPSTMYLTEGISAAATSMKINYVPLAMTKGIVIVDEGTTNEERISFGTVTDNGDNTATLGDLRRGLAYGGGTDYAASGATAYEHTANSSTVRLVVAHEYLNNMVATDRNSLLDTSVEIQFGASTDAIYGDGNELYFKSQTTAAKSLAQLAALSGSDEKAKVSINDTTQDYLINKMTGGSGMTLTETNDGSNETIDFDVDLATDPGLEFSSDQLRVKVKSGGGITRDSDGLSVGTIPTSSFPAAVYGDYGDGSDSTPDWSAGGTVVGGTTYNYVEVTLPVSQTLSMSSGGGAPVTFRTQGDVTINGTIDFDGDGGAGGSGGAFTADGTAGTAGASPLVDATVAFLAGLSTNAGAGGGGNGADGGAGGGGGASPFTAGATGGSQGGNTGGAGGAILSKEEWCFLSMLKLGVWCGAGGGGGGGGNASPNNGGDGGAGGGSLIWFIGGNLTLGASSVFQSQGVAGVDGHDSDASTKKGGGGGGGGAGGYFVFIVQGSVTDNGVTKTMAGGAAGSGGADLGAGPGEDGGAGAVGHYMIYSIQDGTFTVV